ncbi:MAG: SIMPL domain-containing protein [Oceanobacter sp.]
MISTCSYQQPHKPNRTHCTNSKPNNLFSLLLVALTSMLMATVSLAASYPTENRPAEKSLAESRLVQVSATGKASSAPDFLTLNVQLEESQSSLSKAKREIDKSFDLLLKATKKTGISTRDIQAAYIQNYPQYRWNDGKRYYEGERVVRNIKIKLEDIGQYGELVNGIMQIEAAQVQGTEFGFNNPQALYDEALTEALKLARHKAELMVHTLGSKLGPVYAISEGNRVMMPQPVQPRLAMLESAKSSAPAAPMLVQDETVRVEISVTFLID